MEDTPELRHLSGKIEVGLRLKEEHQFVKDASLPLVSIITAVRNGEKTLECTIKSVLDQSYDMIEYIIIDGGSTDGTLDIVRKYDDRITYWVSEPDHGIYDAMNKGIDQATGDWIIFLNAGDEFSDAQVLSQLVPELRGDVDVLYGRHEELYDDRHSRRPPLGNLQDLWKGMVFCHQSMLVRTNLMKQYKFNIRNGIAADYEFIASLRAQHHRFHAHDTLISRILADGYSSTNNVAMIREQWRISKRFFGHTYAVDAYYLASVASVSVKNLVKRCLPRRLEIYLRSRRGR